MTIEEKLEHFLEASLSSSKSQSQKIISDYTNELESEYAEKCSSIDNMVKSRLKLEKEQLIKEHNHELSNRQILIKKEMKDTYENLKEQLFNEVKALLNDFRKTDAYVELLIKKYQAAIDFAGDDHEILYLDPDDTALKETIETRLNRKLTVSEYPFGGGCRTVLAEPKILIDNSFNSRLEEKWNEFTFNGGGINVRNR